MLKIFGIIVTYNPDTFILENNIRSIIHQVDELFVFDNGSNNVEAIKEIEKRFDFQAVYSKENVGLGKAYNTIINKNISRFEYFVTFDQDTFILQNTIHTLLIIINANKEIGVLGPLFSRDNASVSNEGNLLYKNSVIQSCAVFRSKVALNVGDFNEDYFIDSVDFEYCLRIIQNGYKVAMFDGVTIQHDLGEQKKSFGISYFSHNKLRNYYIARNHMDISKKYFTAFPYFILKKNIFFILHISKVIFLERDTEKIRYIIKGIKNKPL